MCERQVPTFSQYPLDLNTSVRRSNNPHPISLSISPYSTSTKSNLGEARQQSINMKNFLLIAIAALATTVMASPASSPNPAAAGPALEARGCLHPSSCRWDWRGRCEEWCRYNGGFDMMNSCTLGKARCCCNRA